MKLTNIFESSTPSAIDFIEKFNSVYKGKSVPGLHTMFYGLSHNPLQWGNMRIDRYTILYDSSSRDQRLSPVLKEHLPSGHHIITGHLYGLFEAVCFGSAQLNNAAAFIDLSKSNHITDIPLSKLHNVLSALARQMIVTLDEMRNEGMHPDMDDLLADEEVSDCLDEVIDVSEQICHNAIVKLGIPMQVMLGEYRPMQIGKLVRDYFKYCGMIDLEEDADAADDSGEWEPED
jgi:hypothetical protein